MPTSDDTGSMGRKDDLHIGVKFVKFLDQNFLPIDMHTEVWLIHEEDTWSLLSVADHQHQQKDLLLTHRKVLIADFVAIPDKFE